MTTTASADVLTVKILGAPRSPNRRGPTTRARMTFAKTERERAQIATMVAARTQGWAPITGPARIGFRVFRHRPLDHDNLVASLKHVIDGVCLALLPLGDGPGTPYEWLWPAQIQVSRTSVEAVHVTVERL